MRVLYHLCGGTVGGAETQVEYLINNLPDDVTALVTYESPSIEKFIFKNIRTKFVHRIFSPLDLDKRIRTFAPDIIQFFHSPSFYKFLSRCHTHAKAIEVVHNRTPFAWDSSTYPKDHTDVLVCVSPDAKAHFESKCGTNLRTIIIPNGVDTDIFTPIAAQAVSRKRLVGGFCGRLEGGDGKGVENLVNIISKLPVDFQLIGHDFGNFKQKTKDMPNIKVLPYTDDMASFYHGLDFFVSCSPKEGFGLAIAEAITCGLPCVVLDCGGICHYLQHKKHAYIAKDLKDVEKGIREVIAGARYNPLSINFSAKSMTQSYMTLYEMLIEEQRASGVKVSTPELPKVVETTDYCLGIVPEGWQGIARAIESRTHSICTPEKAVITAKQKRPSTIIFGGFLARWYPLVRALRQNTGAKITITYHGTALMDEFGHENRDGLIHALAAVREGYADCISFPHEGMARAMNNLHKINAIFEPNTIVPITRPDVVKAEGLHIGLFGTGMPWKNMDTQIIAAAITPKLEMLHIQNLTHPELPNQLGIAYKVHPYFNTDNRKEFYNLAAQMRINLAVTITEAFGYFALESLMLGVPAIVGSTTPSYRLASGHLKRCIVSYIDDPAAISDAIQDVLEHYDLVLEDGRRMLKKLTP